MRIFYCLLLLILSPQSLNVLTSSNFETKETFRFSSGNDYESKIFPILRSTLARNHVILARKFILFDVNTITMSEDSHINVGISKSDMDL